MVKDPIAFLISLGKKCVTNFLFDIGLVFTQKLSDRIYLHVFDIFTLLQNNPCRKFYPMHILHFIIFDNLQFETLKPGEE